MYLGIKTFKVGEEIREVKAVWEPIVDAHTFLRVQKKLKANHSRYKPDSFKKYPFQLSGILYCAVCGAHLCGRSATGNGGKVPYYEHAWMTKRNACLVKKAFDCKPFRVQAKILEPIAWEKIEELLTHPKIAEELLSDAKARISGQGSATEIARLKTKVSEVKGQLEVLAERLSVLPQAVSPEPIYAQMQKLQDIRREHEARLQESEMKSGLKQIPVEMEVYEKFLTMIRSLKVECGSGFLMAKIVKRLIEKVEVTPESVRIHYRVGKNEIQGELAEAGSPPFNFFSSQSLTNGGSAMSAREVSRSETMCANGARAEYV